MTVSDFYRLYASDTAAGSASQAGAKFDKVVTRTGSLRYRLTNGGSGYSLLFSNVIDSTFADGSITRAGDVCGDWDILSLKCGIAHSFEGEPDEMIPVTFDGNETYHVSGPAVFATDNIPLTAKKDDYLVYEITVRGSFYPYHHEIVLSSVVFEDGEEQSDNKIPVPVCVASNRPVEHRIGFIGDSITQGCGTVYDSYTHWPAVIAQNLPEEYSVWDLGIGFARGYDAATCGTWLERASHCDTVNVCFGVNDLFNNRTPEEILSDLRTITAYLKERGCKVIVFTVPPFDMTGELKDYWYEINRVIRAEFKNIADDVFDFAAVLSQPAPNEHLSIHGGHPNAEGCRNAGAAYLQKYYAHDGHAAEFFDSIGEPFCAGIFEKPDSSFFSRYCDAYARYYASLKPTAYNGETLYPCGSSFFNPDCAVRSQFCLTYTTNGDYLERKSPEAKKIWDSFTAISHYPGGWTHGAPNYVRVVKEGLNSYRDRVAAQEDSTFRTGMLRFIDAIKNWHARCLEYLKSVNAPEKLISAAERVPFEPARTLYEGLVAWNFIFYIDGGDNLGCLDYGLAHLPVDGDYTDVIAQLFDNLNSVSTWSCTVGTVYNEITVQAVKAIKGRRRPMLELMVRDGMPEELWAIASENIRAGSCNPSFYNDKGISSMLAEHFDYIPENELCLFCGCGCTETNLMGITRAGGTDGDVSLLRSFYVTMREKLASCKTFDEFFELVCRRTEEDTDRHLNWVADAYRMMGEYLPNPPRTLLFDDCIDNRLDYNAGGARYTWTQNSDSGLINTIDSLIAVKDIIFDRKLYAVEDFLEKLEAEDETLFAVLKTCPHFGVDNEEADEIGAAYARRAYGVYRSKPLKYFIDGYMVTEHQFSRYEHTGRGIGPTPDGRRRDGATCDSVAALRGKALEGPTAMLKSAARLPQNLAEGISVLNLTINKEFVDSSLSSLVRSYFALGGIQVQVTATSEAELKDAMEHPELHGDMIVRVGGYSDYWKNLTPGLRKAVYERNVHDL